MVAATYPELAAMLKVPTRRAALSCTALHAALHCTSAYDQATHVPCQSLNNKFGLCFNQQKAKSHLHLASEWRSGSVEGP